MSFLEDAASGRQVAFILEFFFPFFSAFGKHFRNFFYIAYYILLRFQPLFILCSLTCMLKKYENQVVEGFIWKGPSGIWFSSRPELPIYELEKLTRTLGLLGLKFASQLHCPTRFIKILHIASWGDECNIPMSNTWNFHVWKYSRAKKRKLFKQRI